LTNKPLVIDATNLILGRMMSYVAKRAIEGQDVIILNVSKAVVSGVKRSTIRRAKVKLQTRTLASQDRGPIHPRKPENYARRILRGMLPFKKPKGKNAFRRVRVYADVPKLYAEASLHQVSVANASKLRCHYILLEDLAREIGGA
jgi:large subunit ribosomal protein L13